MNKKTMFSLIILILLNLTASQGFGRLKPRKPTSSNNQKTPSASEINNQKRRSSRDRNDALNALRSAQGNRAFSRIDSSKISKAIETLERFNSNSAWGGCCGFGTTWEMEEEFCENFGIGKVCCKKHCDAPIGNTPCWESRPILCVNKQHIKRPDYDINGHPRDNGWCGGYLCVTEWEIPGCCLQYWKELGDILCQMSCGGDCWQMASNTDGVYNQPNYDDNDHCTFTYPGQPNPDSQCMYCHGDKYGNVNEGDYWVDVPGKNCWNNCCPCCGCKVPRDKEVAVHRDKELAVRTQEPRRGFREFSRARGE